MPAKSLVLEKAARKQLLKLPINIHERIINAFGIIQKNPLTGEKLHGELKGYYKFRLGDYRIVYSFNKEESTITVVKVEHRQGVYK